jgi:toxin YoeB
MGSFTIKMEPKAEKDVKYIRRKRQDLVKKLDEILATLETAPFLPTQQFEHLCWDLKGYCSRRLNKEHRVVYKVTAPNVVVISCLGHY